MKDKRIHIPAKKISTEGDGIIRIAPEAMECLAEVMNETRLSVRQAVSLIIIQAVKNDLIDYDREEKENE